LPVSEDGPYLLILKFSENVWDDVNRRSRQDVGWCALLDENLRVRQDVNWRTFNIILNNEFVIKENFVTCHQNVFFSSSL
jgi:hypothetical protein